MFQIRKLHPECIPGSQRQHIPGILCDQYLPVLRGTDPAGAADFVKDGKTLLDGLMLYRTDDGFTHKAGGDTDMMATQQAMLALIAAEKGAKGESVFE